MSELRRAVTIRLPVSRYRRLERAARAERQSLDRHLENLIERELAVQDEAGGAIRMFVPPDAESLRHTPGELLPTPGESDERYAERQQIFAALMKLPIAVALKPAATWSGLCYGSESQEGAHGGN